MGRIRIPTRFKTRSWWQPILAIAATLAGLSILGGSAYLVTSLTQRAQAPDSTVKRDSARVAGPLATPTGEAGAFNPPPPEGSAGDGADPGAGAVPRFSISCSPGKFPAGEGNAGANTCTVKSLAGFSQAIELSCANLPPALSCEFSPLSVTPPANGYASSKLQLWWDNVRPGNYNFRVVGRSGPMTRYFVFPFRKTDSGPKTYTLQCPQTPTGEHIRLLPGQQGDVACTVAPQGGFSGPVMLGCSRSGGIDCSFAQNRIFVQPFSQGTANLTINVPKKATPGMHELFVQTYSSESEQRAGQPYRILVQVPSTAPPSFRLDCDEPSLSLVEGTSGSLNCRVSSINGFEGDVSFDLAHQTGFVPYSLNPPSLKVTPDGAPIPLTFTLDATTLAPGKYGLYLSATSTDDSNGTQLELSVTPAPAPNPTESAPAGGSTP
jgi:hypothetical protein